MTPEDLAISNLGDCRFRSPLRLSTVRGDGIGNFVSDSIRVLREIEFSASEAGPQLPVNPELAFERAGAREHLFFDPPRTRAAIVTCGGLCPGLNNVIRTAFFELNANYGVPDVLGIRFGYEGLNPQVGLPPLKLSRDLVEEIHKAGGTILGSSRGHQQPQVVVDFLTREKIDILICVGGDGTQRGAHAIGAEVARRDLKIAVVGIPKTIDNDIPFVDRSFGYATALEKAKEHITGAHNEARGVRGGIGLVKLMGRHAGFIAAGATLASGQVNFTMIPEVPCQLDGEGGLLARLERRILDRHHAVIVVAEGAGQDLLADRPDECDASGNRKLGDIGEYLSERICGHFDERKIPIRLKYFDPSYHVRSVPANTADSLLSNQMARRAVHAAMAGKTDLLVGLIHNLFVHVPLPLVNRETRRVDPESDLWIGVRAATGQ